MKTPEGIKRGLDMCHCDYEECDTCSLADLCNEKAQGLAYIQQLEQDNARKDERIRQLERDNAYLMRIARDSCTMCKNVFVYVSDEPCASCINGHGARDNWEWRGVEEDNHAED